MPHQGEFPPQQPAPQQLPPHITIDNLPPHYHLLTSPTCLPRPDDHVAMPTHSSMEGSVTTADGQSEADVSLSRFGVDLESRASDVSGMPQEEFLR